MDKRSILVVDNNKEYCEKLLEDLRSLGNQADGVGSGEEAVALLTNNPQGYQFAVIDHKLSEDKNKLDGIDTTKELVKINRTIYIVVFTNIPTDDIHQIAKFKWLALSNGAYRYLSRGIKDPEKQIQDFIDEIEQLSDLKGTISNFYRNEANVPSLLTQLDIGVDVIDHSYKIWFMNDAMHRITGIKGPILPMAPCAHWHGYHFSPCPNCLVNSTFINEEPHYRLFLSPFPFRESNVLYYLNVWTQPLKDRNNNILRNKDERLLAVMESVQDLTGSSQVIQMPIDERLKIISNSLKNFLKKDYLPVLPFEYVKIYTPSEQSGDFILKAASGYEEGSVQLGIPVQLQTSVHLRQAVENMKNKQQGTLFQEKGSRDPVITAIQRDNFMLWPIIRNGKTVAVIEASGEKCTEDIVKLTEIEPHADEVLSAILDYRQYQPKIEINKSINRELGKLKTDLLTSQSPLRAIQMMVKRLCEFTKSQTYVMRYKQEQEAVLLPLGLEKYNRYEKVAQRRYPLTHLSSWSVTTIVSGHEQHISTINNKEEIMRRRESLSPEGEKALKDTKSLCFEPLIYSNQCIGTIGLHAKDPRNYSDEKKIFSKEIARRLAQALHDYMIEKKAGKRVKETQNDIFGLVLHNIQNPLGIIRICADILSERIKALSIDSVQKEKLIKEVESIKYHHSRTLNVRDEYLKLNMSWKTRIVKINLHNFLERLLNEYKKDYSEISFEISFDNKIKKVLTDLEAIDHSLKVLLQNSIDATNNVDERVIEVVLRGANETEREDVQNNKDFLAIDVIDNGCGVSENMKEKLFNIVHSTKANGLGFGLARCNKVILAAGGKIFYDDHYNKGTKFTFILPYQ